MIQPQYDHYLSIIIDIYRVGSGTEGSEVAMREFLPIGADCIVTYIRSDSEIQQPLCLCFRCWGLLGVAATTGPVSNRSGPLSAIEVE